MSKVHRFSAGLTETMVGPSGEAIARLAELAMKARDASLGAEDAIRFSDFVNFGLWNNPVYPLNLFYVRPALDYLFLNSMREAASPGYLKRSLRSGRKTTGNRKLRYWNRDKKDGGLL